MARYHGGWIKSHRKLLINGAVKDLIDVGLLHHIFLLANRTESEAQFAGKSVILQPGQLITGLNELKLNANQPAVSTVSRRLGKYEQLGIITQRIAKQGRLITVCKWDEYQSSEERPINDRETNDKRSINKRETNDKQTINKRELNGEERRKKKEEIKEDTRANKEQAHLKFSPEEFIEVWNENCGPLPKVKRLSNARRTKIKARAREGPNLDEWRTCIRKIAGSSFCCGKSDSGWIATLTWLIKNDDNYDKVIEGQYDDRTPRMGAAHFEGERQRDWEKEFAGLDDN